MKCQSSFATLAMLFILMVAFPATVSAWNSMGVGAEIYGNEWDQQLCNNTFAAFPAVVAVNDPFSPAFASQRLQARDAEANTYWMWLREGGLSPVWQWSATCAPRNPGYPGGDWFDGSEAANNNWYETQAVMDNISLYCATGSIGCTGLDYAWWGASDILAADIVMSNTCAWNTVNQDTLRECLIRTETTSRPSSSTSSGTPTESPTTMRFSPR